MRNRILSSVLLMALLILAVTSAVARDAVVRPLDPAEAQEIALGVADRQACQVGNLNAASWAVGGWMAAPEEYKLAFDPGTTCSVCPIGWKLTAVHILIQTAEACDFVMAVDLEEADYLPGGCTYPGPEICNSGLYNVAIPSAGLWDISLPIDCECAYFGFEYLLSVHFDSMTCTPDLVTDALPTACTSWNNWGAGWFDLVVDGGFPGNLLIWGDVDCCDPPVDSDKETWGGIKGMYR